MFLPPFSCQLLTWRSPRPLLVFWLVRTLICVVIFLFAGVALDVTQVLGLVFLFLDYLGCIDPGGWTVFSSASMTFFGVLNLRLISSKRGLRLSLFLGSLIVVLPLGIFLVLLGQRTVAFWAFEINLPNIGG